MYRAPRWVSPCRLLSIVLDAPYCSPYLSISFYFSTSRLSSTRSRPRDPPRSSYVYCAILSTLKYRKHCNYSNVVSSDALWKFKFYCVRSKLSSTEGMKGEGKLRGFAIDDRLFLSHDLLSDPFF